MAHYTLQLDESEINRYRMIAGRAREREQTWWTAAGVAPGAKVADVGCGPGAVLAVLAEIVGPSGSVVGVDADPGAVATARQTIELAGLSNASVVQAGATDTGLEPGSLDVAMMRLVLAHNGGIEQRIVNHLAELVRPGGVVYLVDVDLTGIRVFPPPSDDWSDMAARYINYHRSLGNDPQIGLRLQHLLQGAGLEPLGFEGVIHVVRPPKGAGGPAWAARAAMLAAGFIDQADVERWKAAIERQDAAPEAPLMFAPNFVAFARRPS